MKTIEELTLHSLDCTPAGLDDLAGESRRCAEALIENPAQGLQAFRTLAEKLHGFDVFCGDVMSLFKIVPGTIRDGRGDMETCGLALRTSLDRMPRLLARDDIHGLARLLRSELPDALARFRELVPVLRNYIDAEYVQRV